MTRLLSITALLLASVACAGRRRAEPPAVPPGANCEGRLYLEVTNTLNESVDVYVGDVYAGENRRTLLGTVGPGTTRLPVENWLRTYPRFAVEGRPVARAPRLLRASPNAPLAISGVPKVCQGGRRSTVVIGIHSAIASPSTPRTARVTDFSTPR
jgi:hypothetical protein